MSHAITVEFDREPEYYTSGDVVSGTIHLKVTREIQVKDIQIKLQGHSTSTVSGYRVNRKGERRRETWEEGHEVLYDVLTVFPPPNVRDAVHNRKPSFTLTPGSYSYPFELKFPITAHCGDPESKMTANLFSSRYEDGQRKKHFSTYSTQHGKYILPPSVSTLNFPDNTFKVRYSLKVSLHRANFFSMNTRMERVLIFFPRGPSSIQAVDLMQSRLFLHAKPSTVHMPTSEPKKHWYSSTVTRPIEFTFGVTTSQSLIPGTQPFSLHVLSRKPADAYTYDTKDKGKISLAKFYLTDLSIELMVTATFSAHGHRTQQYMTFPLFIHKGGPVTVDLSTLSPSKLPSSAFSYALDLTKILEGFNLSAMIPSFSICNGNVSQSVLIRAQFSPYTDGSSSTKCEIAHNVTVCPPIMDIQDSQQTVYTAPPADTPPAEVPSTHAPTAAPASKEEEELPTYQDAVS
ncbi:Arrestin-related trafficking adapter 10 [Cyberlindnera fabianii]|uniref:Arrestin-related trafficking adapter 10 n=2 Tax=Cyberlindnera fabianii TaxID=36022 RepID=A0A1V2LA51_CYBFA|nr:Arrestin-related trafficking adapter 10 [Cyberlindnera fabianii]